MNRDTSLRASPRRSFRPDVSAYEWYAKWALRNYRPCNECSPDYQAMYGKLWGMVEAAETCFEAAYQVYGELARMSSDEVARHEFLQRKREEDGHVIS